MITNLLSNQLKYMSVALFIACMVSPFSLKAEETDQNAMKGKSLSELHALASKNSAQALNELGHIYFRGLEGVDVDKQKGFDFLMQAAQLNHGPAQFFIALIYDGGLLGETDSYKAAEYYRKSADNAFTPALYSLGDMYIKGQGVVKNVEQGLGYWHQAAELGESEAQYALGVYYINNNDPKKGLTYTKLAAKQNHPNAAYNLGVLYSKGIAVEQNEEQAIKYFKIACNLNSFPLCNNLFQAP